MKNISRATLILLASTMSVSPVLAANEGLIGGFLGGIGAAIVINEINKSGNKSNSSGSSRQKSQQNSAQREQMRDIQTRLNTLGYDVGAPDGISGPRTRQAISDFQGSIGSMPTGELSSEELGALFQQSNGIGFAQTPGAMAPAPSVGAFPTLAGVPAANGATTVNPFPSLGGPQANPSPGQQSAFPTMGGRRATPSPNQQSAFPTLAAPTVGKNPSAFPTIGTPTAALAVEPPMVDGGVEALGVPLTASFDEELGKTSYLTFAEQPQILGFSLGTGAATFTKALEENGFENCVGSQTALQCQRQTETLSDTIKVWSTQEDGVWAVARLIRFTEPVQAKFLLNQFSSTYPAIMEQPQRMVTSSPACDLNSHGVPTLAALFDQRDAAGSKEIPQSLVDLSVKCPVAYTLSFNQGNGLVAAVQTIFFDGTSVVRQQVSVADSKKTQVGQDLKF